MEVFNLFLCLTSSLFRLMEVIPESHSGIIRACELLRSGGVVVHGTETCYGIACDLSNPAAVQKLFDIKKRPSDQPVSALFSSIDAARLYVDISQKAEELLMKYLPGPLTLVLPIKKNPQIPLYLTRPSRLTTHYSLPTSVGVRISSHPFAMKLATAFGSPIATTSANIHGEANPYGVADIETQWEGQSPQPDLIIDSGVLPSVPASTVIKIANGNITVLRQGSTIIA